MANSVLKKTVSLLSFPGGVSSSRTVLATRLACKVSKQIKDAVWDSKKVLYKWNMRRGKPILTFFLPSCCNPTPPPPTYFTGFPQEFGADFQEVEWGSGENRFSGARFRGRENVGKPQLLLPQGSGSHMES